MVNSRLLFTAERLRLNSRIKMGRLEGDRLTIKSLDDRGYLTVDELQWEALRAFAEPRTAPDVMRQLLRDRKCPALKDFYELILKAQEAGILQRATSHGILQPAADWKLGLPRIFGSWLGGCILLLGIVSAAIHPPALAALDATQWKLVVACGYVACAVGLSLGSVFAASILRKAGGEIYRPRLRWAWLVPHFAADLEDLRIMDRATRIAIHLALLAPTAALVAALAWSQPAWSFLPLVLLLGLLRPVLGGTATAIITAARGHPLLDTSYRMLFEPNRSWSGMYRAARQHFDSRVVALRIIWGVIWIAAALELGFVAAGVPFAAARLGWEFWRGAATIFAGIVAAAILAMLYFTVAAQLREPLRRFAAARQLGRNRRLQPFRPITSETINATLALSAVCQRLAPQEREQLARLVKPVAIPAHTRLLDFGHPVTEAWLLVSGAVDVYRRTPAGRVELAWQACEGDLVGVEFLLEQRLNGWRLRARTPLVALALSKEVLEQEIVGRIDAATLRSLLLWAPFLRHIPLCRNWHAQALARFATLSTSASFPDGEIVLRSGQQNQRLFMIYEGSAVITRDGRRIAVVRTGEFFGEIGMLQDSPANAQVNAGGPLTCLCLNKGDFLHFLSHNYEVALEVEHVSSKRLGHPIFPLKSGGINVA